MQTNTDVAKWTASGMALVGAVIVLLKVFSAIEWTDPETATVTAFALTVFGVGGALYAHFRAGSKREPVALIGTVSAAVTALVSMLMTFGVGDLDQEEAAAILGVVAVVATVVGTLLARGGVSPTEPQDAFH